MRRDGCSFKITLARLTSATILSGVTVQNFFPWPLSWNAHPVPLIACSCEIAEHQDQLSSVVALTEKTDDTPLRV